MEKFNLAIIADSDIEEIFDSINIKDGYKNAQLCGKNCAFLSARNNFLTNLQTIKKLNIKNIVEITNSQITNEELIKEDGIEYVGFLVKGTNKKSYIKSMLTCFINEKSENSSSNLSEREREVLELISKGYSNKDIAKELFLSEKTVKNHVSSIFKKINVTDRTKAAIYAISK